MKPFVAIDGEAIGDDYVLMCDSEGGQLADLTRGGLTTRECLEFLVTRPPGILVCFGLGYDVNNWLRDVPRPALEALWENKVCHWREWRLEWVPGRWFSVKDINGRKARVSEVFGFFQSSFVKALEAWGIGAPAQIARMKAARGTFTADELDEVTSYCISECRLLVELMDQLRGACSDSGLTPQQWIGAGSIASALLNRQGVGPHHAYDLDLLKSQPETVEDAVLGAYYAGRIELVRQGVFRGVSTADLRSAYPAAARTLPSLDGARLIHRKRFDPSKFGVWRVSWDLRGANAPALAPFPTRRKQAIWWPLAGSGWYHGVEVAAAIEAGYPVTVHEGWVLRQGSDDQPFGWIADVYRERARLKREGRAAEKVVKLGLNSVYGKLAQGYGFRGRPRWQNYLWAGYITAATRAAILRFANRCEGVMMIATDGIFCQSPGPYGRSKGLGSWERGEVAELFTAQAGVYQGITPDSEIVKSRGFFASEVDYSELRAGWEIEGAEYVHHYESKRFMGLGVSLMRKDFGVWRSWRTERRALILAPERKGIEPDGRLIPPAGPVDSEPYRPKITLVEGRALDQVQGMDQPMREEI